MSANELFSQRLSKTKSNLSSPMEANDFRIKRRLVNVVIFLKLLKIKLGCISVNTL